MTSFSVCGIVDDQRAVHLPQAGQRVAAVAGELDVGERSCPALGSEPRRPPPACRLSITCSVSLLLGSSSSRPRRSGVFSWLRMKNPGPSVGICLTVFQFFMSMTLTTPSLQVRASPSRRAPASAQVMPEPRCGMPGRSTLGDLACARRGARPGRCLAVARRAHQFVRSRCVKKKSSS